MNEASMHDMVFTIQVSFLSVVLYDVEIVLRQCVCQMFLPCFPSKCESISACCHHPMTYVFFMEYAIMICYVFFKPTVTTPQNFLHFWASEANHSYLDPLGLALLVVHMKNLGLEMVSLLTESSQAQHTSFQIKKSATILS